MTKKEIALRWIRKQNWAPKWMANALKNDENFSPENCRLEHLVSGVFVWKASPEGQDFWVRADRDFKKNLD